MATFATKDDMVAPRDLRNHSGDLLARAEAGEHIDVVRDGRVIATIGPSHQPAVTPRARLVEIFQASEAIDADQFFGIITVTVLATIGCSRSYAK